MTGVLLMGLVHRERHGPGNIGVESVALFALYLAGSALRCAILAGVSRATPRGRMGTRTRFESATRSVGDWAANQNS
jgi:cation:H+ antiporter